MAATNPFRVSDLVAKYGWQAMIYLAALGIENLAEAQVLFVDSGHTNALDADDTEHGHSFEKPLDTLDYAIGLCTAGERSVILVAPGHNDPLGDEQIDFDVSDITVIGIGEGTNKPTINFDNANSSVLIGANNVHLINLRFLPAVTDVLVGVDIETGKTGTIIEKCDFAEGENAPDEFIISLDIKAGCNNTKVTNCLFRTKVAAAGCTNGIQLNDASDNVIIEKCRLVGNYSNAAINGITNLSTDVLIDDVTIKTADSSTGIKMYTGTTGIIRNACIYTTGTAVDSLIVADTMSWFNNLGVLADGAAAEIIGGGEVNAQLVAHGLDHLVTLADGATVRPDSVVEDSILAKLMGSPDPATIATYDNTKHSLEAIGDDTDLILADTITISGGALPENPTADSLARFIAGGGTALGQSLPTNMSLIDLLGDFTGGYDGTEQNDNVKASLDLAHTALDKVMGSAVGQHSPFSRVNHSFGTVYFVDKATGSDSDDGLSPANAFLTIGAAITASNITVGDYLQNAIYVNANTYTEDLTTLPVNCDVIGVGSKCRIAGNHTDSAWNCHWHNFEFRSGVTSAPIMTLQGDCHGNEFHSCRFKNNSANTTIGLEIQNGFDGVIEDCYFGGNPQLPIAIKFSSTSNIGWRILNNVIGATTTGIELAATLASCYQNLIKGNYIGRQDPNSDEQMTTGIKELKTDGHSGFAIIDNNIEAVDAILFTYTGGTNYHQWACIRNYINENGTASIEDGAAIT